jgi:opacity protein-like surface antigen
MYLGGDIFYNYLNPTINTMVDFNTLVPQNDGLEKASEKIKQTNSLGLAAHLGYALGNTLPYGLLGTQYTPVKITANTTVAFDGAGGGSVTSNLNRSFNQWGWLFGAGIQTVITEHFRAGLEYDYVYQNRITAESDGRLFVTSSFNPNISTIIARLSYVFNP